MFKKKTVFILGAGASWHYGYPTGEDLVGKVRGFAKEIQRLYSIPDEYNRVPRGYSQMHPQHFRGDEFSPFINNVSLIEGKIAQANPLVIDDFLGGNKEVADVGKLLIAMALFQCENEQKIRPKKKDAEELECEAGDWVRYIVHQLTVDCERPEDLLANQVSFVTFNYDLSLERRLFWALANYQRYEESGVSDGFFSSERFHHVYGQLYEFDTNHPDAPDGSYGNSYFPLADEIDRAYDAAKNIRTISPDEKSAAPEIVSAIAEAENLYFLGYGFDRRNNELLGLGRRQDGSGYQSIKFTNFRNHNKVSKQVARTFNISEMDLVGESYLASSRPHSANRYSCEKSIKSVYDALAEDFDWPE